MRLKKGFTLSETLITLGIIGIIAAMTLPSIIGKYQKTVTVNKLKKIYSVFSQALLCAKEENGSPSNWVNDGEIINKESAEKYFNQYWKPYIKTSRICKLKTNNNCGYKTATAWKRADGISFDTGVVDENTRTSFFMPDGTFVLLIYFAWDTSGESLVAKFSKTQRLYIDINGTKAPNTFGKDVFYFLIDLENGTLEPPNLDQSKESLIKNCKREGYVCSTLIIQSGWQMDKDYPL